MKQLMLCVSDSSQWLLWAHSYALEDIHLLIFVLQIQYFYNSFKVSHVCLERDSIFLSDDVSAQRNQWVVHWRLHDMLLLEVLFDDCLMLSSLDLGKKSLVKILSCVLSYSSECRPIQVRWWLIAALSPRRSCSSKFSHWELVFLAPLSRSFYHDGRDPNASTFQVLRFGMSWQRTIDSVSCWISGVFLSNVVSILCWTMFLELSLLFSASCWSILSFSCRCCAALSNIGNWTTPREDVNNWSWLASRVSWTSFAVFLSFVLCHLVSFQGNILMFLITLTGSLHHWSTMHDVTLTVKTFLTWRTSIRRELFHGLTYECAFLSRSFQAGHCPLHRHRIEDVLLYFSTLSLDSVPHFLSADSLWWSAPPQQIKKSEQRIILFSARCWLASTPACVS